MRGFRATLHKLGQASSALVLQCRERAAHIPLALGVLLATRAREGAMPGRSRSGTTFVANPFDSSRQIIRGIPVHPLDVRSRRLRAGSGIRSG